MDAGWQVALAKAPKRRILDLSNPFFYFKDFFMMFPALSRMDQISVTRGVDEAAVWRTSPPPNAPPSRGGLQDVWHEGV